MLVFETPKSFEFAVEPGRWAKVLNWLVDVPGAVTTFRSVEQKTD